MAAAKKPAPKKTAASRAQVIAGPSKADEARWRAENDLRTLQSMSELKRDPSRIRAAEKLLQEQLAAVKAAKGK